MKFDKCDMTTKVGAVLITAGMIISWIVGMRSYTIDKNHK